MAIVKLVCQGCGANLDVLDNQRTFECGYCGITNRITKPAHEQPAAPSPVPQQLAQLQNHLITSQSKTRGGIVGIFVLLITVLPLVVVGIVMFTVFRTTTDSAMNTITAVFGGGSGAGADGRDYSWDSSRPFIDDVNGDGTEDVVGLIRLQGSQEVLLMAMSGTDWSTLWEIELGKRSEMPGQTELRYEPKSQLLSFSIGTTMTAYDAKTGAERWISNFSDGIDEVRLDGDHLWVGTIDKKGSEVSLADGKVTPGEAEPSDSAVLLRDDEGYELIPALDDIDLPDKKLGDLRVVQGFCPKHELSRAGNGTHHCAHPRGLVYAVRSKGTQVPFWVGYDPVAKTESWRVQLTKPGTLETVDSGFGQPRAELFGDDAVVAFVPEDNNSRIRRISLVDGSTAWEVTLTQTMGSNVEGMVVASDRVFVTYGASVHVLSLADGAEQAVLGSLF